MRDFEPQDQLYLGACYYPEHWPEKLWEDDYRRMTDLGLSVIRVAEFAWTIFEPQEGIFSFDLFDRAIDLAHRYGLKVVFGTPTATPPAWLTHKYPEVLNVTRDGVAYQHGQRRHYNYNAPIYRELSARIVRKLAEHYSDHPAVVGWQIDNEINCEVNVFYSQADHAAFREWLKSRYGNLEQLNAAWGAVFWNQTYTDWEQVYLTRPTPSQSPNPHQALDEKRFISDSAISYVKMQSDIIRSFAPHQFVTTNGLFGHLDSHRMAKEALDFFSYDSYPNFAAIYPDEGPDPLLDRRWGFYLSLARDVSRRFWVMEQQSGPGGWVNRMASPSPKPGQMRLWTYQSIAHGADAVLYFRWRTAPMGTEIYWHGINDYHNQPNRRVDEAGRVGREFAKLAEVAGSQFQADVALLRDYDNEWDGELDKWLGPLTKQSELSWYKALQYRHIPLEIVNVGGGVQLDDLLRFKALIYPHAAILSDRTAELLSQYVRHGGQVVFGCRSGYKDESGHCPMRPLPGPIADLCGVNVDDFTLIGTQETAPTVLLGSGAVSEAIFADRFNDVLTITADDAQILATYDGSYYAGKPALVRRPSGSGFAYYYGAAFNRESAEMLIELLDLRSPVQGILTLPPAVELCIRRQPATGEEYWFLLNYSAEEQKIEIVSRHTELMTLRELSGSVAIAPFDVLILKA